MADREVPGMEVEIALSADAFYAELEHMMRVFNSAEGKLILEAKRIEEATGGMFNLSGATSGIQMFGNSTSKELREVALTASAAERAGEKLVRQLEREVETFGKTSTEIRQMRAELRAADADAKGLTELAGRIRATSAELDRLHGANDNFVKSGTRGRNVVAQLIPQFNDLGVQFAMAAQSSTPLQMGMMALIQQGTQIQQIGMQAGVGIGAMAKQTAVATGAFLMAHPAILAVGAGIGTAMFAFKGFSDTLEKRAPVDDYVKTLGLTTDEVKKLTDTHVTLGDAAGAAWDMISKALGLEDIFKKLNGWVSQSAMWLYAQFKDATASIYGFFKAAYDNVGLLWKNLPALLGDAVTATVNEVLSAAQFMVNDAIGKINWLADKSNSIFGTSFGQIGKVDLSSYKGQYSAAGKEFAAAFGASFNAGYKQAMSGFEAIENGAIANRNSRLKKQADDLISDRKKSSTKASDDAAKEAAKQEKWLADQRMAAQGNVWKLAQDMEKRNRDLKLEGLTIGDKMLKQDQERAKQREIELQSQRQILDMYLRQFDAVSRIGGVAGNAAGVLAGILDGGNFVGVQGKLGKMLDLASGSVGTDGWKEVTDKLDTIFGTAGDGSFARIMSKTFAAGGVGSLAGSLVLGDKSSGLGSFAGGAIGKEVGAELTKSVTGMLGKLGGPIGSIVGGVLGGALGGLLTKAKWGTSVVTGQDAGSISTGGNKAAYSSNSGLAADSIQTGLQAIADQLGADIGGYNVSIGQYKGKWRVSSTGRSGKLKGGSGRTDIKDFGEDGAEDAIRWAIADAVSDGALLGLRASTQRLMQGGKDVEAQLAKALQFEGVFSELKSMTDPVGYAIDNLDKEFAQLRKTFEQAGASAEEYAQLQQLYDLKRIDALKQANEEAESLTRDRRTLEARIMELQGKTIESVAAMRQIELEQMEASLRPLQEQVWALEDAKEAADAAKQLADTWGSIGDSIMDEVRRIRGLTDTGSGGSFASLFGQFNAATNAARGGDQDAANKLVSLSQSVLDAAALSATSRQELERIRAQIAASLEQTAGMVGTVKGAVLAAATPLTPGLVNGGPAAATLAAAAQAVPPASSNDNATIDSLRQEFAGLRSDMIKGLAQVSSNTGKTARILDDVTGENGGRAIAVSGVGT